METYWCFHLGWLLHYPGFNLCPSKKQHNFPGCAAVFGETLSSSRACRGEVTGGWRKATTWGSPRKQQGHHTGTYRNVCFVFFPGRWLVQLVPRDLLKCNLDNFPLPRIPVTTRIIIFLGSGIPTKAFMCYDCILGEIWEFVQHDRTLAMHPAKNEDKTKVVLLPSGKLT